MKKLFLLLFFAISTITSAYAQKYLQTGLTWEIYLGYNMWAEETLIGDTIMNGHTYFIHNWNTRFYLRDDDTGLYAYFPKYDLETQLYSYDLAVGDTLTVVNGDFLKASWGWLEPDWDGIRYGTFNPHNGIVVGVDTIILQNGEPRRKIQYQCGKDPIAWFIEGIGTARGLTGENVNEEDSRAHEVLLCCHTKNAILWDNGHCPDVKQYYPCACELGPSSALPIIHDTPSAVKQLIDGRIVISAPDGKRYSILGLESN